MTVLKQLALDSDRNFGPQSDSNRFTCQNDSTGVIGLKRKMSVTYLRREKDPYFITIFIE